MALVIADRVRESSTTTGTGSISLGGAVTGYQTFLSAIGSGNTTYYLISNTTNSEWEYGIGTVSSGTLSRSTVISSSNLGAVVNFTAGAKDVLCSIPVEKAVYLDANGNVVPNSAAVSVKDFGAVGNGVTDDTVAIQAALTYIASVSAVGPLPPDFSNKPTLYFPHGVYLVSTPFAAITFNGLHIKGEGVNTSVIYYTGTSNSPLFDIGSFSTAPTDIFNGPIGTHFENISLLGLSSQTAGARKSQGIRCSGGGSLTIENVLVEYFAYGVNCPYGGDFNSYINLSVSYCDVGVYQGPGGQQWYSANLNIFGSEEGIVIDRAVHGHFAMPILNSNHLRGVLFECLTEATTRQLTTLPGGGGGIGFFGDYVFDTPWLESNAGGLGANFVTTHYFENRNGGSDAYRNIVINNPFVVAGASGSAITTSIFGSTSGLTAQNVTINNLRFSGTISYVFYQPFGSLLNGFSVQNGYSTPAISDNTSYTYNQYTAASDIKHTSSPFIRETAAIDGVNRIQEVIDMTDLFIKWNFWLASSSYITRLSFDVQNRKICFGDISSGNDPIINHGSYNAMPTTGSWAKGSFIYNINPVVASNRILLGWSRLTTGSANVAGTDWVPCYVSTV